MILVSAGQTSSTAICTGDSFEIEPSTGHCYALSSGLEFVNFTAAMKLCRKSNMQLLYFQSLSEFNNFINSRVNSTHLLSEITAFKNFWTSLRLDVESSNVTNAVWLSSNATDTLWLWDEATGMVNTPPFREPISNNSCAANVAGFLFNVNCGAHSGLALCKIGNFCILLQL